MLERECVLFFKQTCLDFSTLTLELEMVFGRNLVEVSLVGDLIVIANGARTSSWVLTRRVEHHYYSIFTTIASPPPPLPLLFPRRLYRYCIASCFKYMNKKSISLSITRPQRDHPLYIALYRSTTSPIPPYSTTPQQTRHTPKPLLNKYMPPLHQCTSPAPSSPPSTPPSCAPTLRSLHPFSSSSASTPTPSAPLASSLPS